MKKKLLPFILTLLVIAADQLTKLWIVRTIPPFTIGYDFFGGILRIIHVANKGVAFSIGYSLSATVRSLLFSLIPLVVIGVVIGIYFRNEEFNQLQRCCICAIVGGGLGNIIDRIFRPEGVVDFIDVKFYGLFGLERWPTFNVADAAIVVSGIILIVSFMLTMKGESAKSGAEK